MIGVPIIFVVLLWVPYSIAKGPVYLPNVWLFLQVLSPKLKTGTGSSATSEVVIPNKYEAAIASLGAGAGNIAAIVSDCVPQLQEEGEKVDGFACFNAVLTAGIGSALVATRYRSTGTWFKRDTSNIDEFMSAFPESVKITDIKVSGQPLAYNSSSPAVRRRDIYGNEPPINVDYNGSLPLSFIYHHSPTNLASNLTSNSTGNIPIFIATDGEHFHISHIRPISQNSQAKNQTAAYSRRRSMVRRAGINSQYSHVGTGGIKVQSKTMAVATWSQVQDWLDPQTQFGPMYWFHQLAIRSMWIGHSFQDYVVLHSAVDFDRMSGQFIIEGESAAFSNKWEKNWNWCFGVEKTNCEKGVQNVGR